MPSFKLNGKLPDQEGMECHYTGNRKSGDLFILKFMRKEHTLEDIKSSIIRYIMKYVIKNANEASLRVRAVMSELNIRPFSKSRSLFPLAVMRKVRNEEGKPLYDKYTLYELTKKLRSGEAVITIMHMKYHVYQTMIEESEWNGIPLEIETVGWREHTVMSQRSEKTPEGKPKIGKIAVTIDGETYMWEAGKYYIGQNQWIGDYLDDQEDESWIYS